MAPNDRIHIVRSDRIPVNISVLLIKMCDLVINTMAQWPHMKTFLDYLKKRCEELTGEHVCSLAMLFPSTALQSRLPDAPVPDIALHQTAEELLSRQRDFELIDEETLSEQSPAAFAALRPFFLLAHADVIEEKTARWLEEYAACGGKLFVAGVVPELLPSRPGEAAGKWLFAEKCCVPDYISQIPAPEIKVLLSRFCPL